jgi:DNA-binding transcriptional LysR family regulator
MNWNDFRYILPISRGGMLARAARLLGVEDSTVARRLNAMQAAIGTRLFHRPIDGTLQLTAGERNVLHAQRIESEIGALGPAQPIRSDMG